MEVAVLVDCIVRQRRYYAELGLAMVAYFLLIYGSISLMRAVPMGKPAEALVCLVPMLPAAAAGWIILRHIRRMDEMQRQVQLEALAFSFAGTGLITFSYGFLEGVGFPRLTMFLVWPLMAGLWSVGGILAQRRYR